MRAALLSLALAVAPGSSLQAQHASSGHAMGCDLCHGSHVADAANAGRLVMTTRTKAAGPAVVSPPGLTRIALSCLRCHYSPAVRSTEMKPSQLAAAGGATGGKHVGNTLLTGHKMGGSSEPQCGSCHSVHTPGQLQPAGTEERATCTTCHAAESSHPDPSHVTMACSSCHRIHVASFSSVSAPRLFPSSSFGSIATRKTAGGASAAKIRSTPASGANGAIDAECRNCHMSSGDGLVTAGRLPSIQVDLIHAARGPCVGCHLGRTGE